MKTNEIIQEGPIDFYKKVAAGYNGLSQGGLAGAKAGYTQQAAANTQADKTNAIAKKAIDQWNTTAAQISQGGTPATADQAVQWLGKFLGKAPAGKPAGDAPAQINQFITQEITKHIADRAAQGLGGQQPAAANPTQATAPTNTAQATAPAAGASEPEATPAEPAAPAKPGANEFAQKLQADFDQFSSAGGSIGAPAVKQVIKNMWMRAGGTKAESKKNKKKPV